MSDEPETPGLALFRACNPHHSYNAYWSMAEESRAVYETRAERFLASERDHLAATLDRVRALHKPFGIYDECDHDHDEREPGVIHTGDFLTCSEMHMYDVCAHCCLGDGGDQLEDCLYHDHGNDKPICATRAILDAPMTGDDQ